MNLDAIVKILGIGLSGFGFLLMYLSFQLIKTIVSNPNPGDVQKISLTKNFLWVTIVMTFMVGIFTYISGYHKADQLAQQANDIKSKTDTLKLLSVSQKSTVLSDTISKYATSDSNKLKAAKIEQGILLDTLTKYANNLNNKDLVKQVAAYKKAIIAYPDSALNGILTTEKKDSLKTLYNNASKNLFKVVTKQIASNK
jgi:uncharacterized protein YaaR (DUF327 family)